MEENYKTPADPSNDNPGETSAERNYVAPGVPIVRTSTPRPLPFFQPMKTELPLAPSASSASFPAQAPDAPPLPEEPTSIDEGETEQLPLLTPQPATEPAEGDAGQAPRPVASEFIWLFEYALDMEAARLNRPERLNGSAFAYGPALLKGYRLAFEGLDARAGHVVASLREERNLPEAEVWGMLYRVPRRFTIGGNGEASLLDRVHCADTFVPIEVQVHEPYRQREITCIAYIAVEATRQRVSQLASENRLPEPAYCKRLLQIARRQKLPISYLRVLEDLVPPGIPAATSLPTAPPEQNTEPLLAMSANRTFRQRLSEQKAIDPLTESNELNAPPRQVDPQPAERSESRPSAWKAKSPSVEARPSPWKAKRQALERNEPPDPWQGDQRTAEPRPASRQADTPVARSGSRPTPWSVPYPSGIERWLMVFALYVSLLLLGALVLAIFQGMGFWPNVFTKNFTPLGIPWYVLLYGLLGGCASCVISLNRPASGYPPAFVVLTWFARPFLGAILGAFASLLLNSGAVVLSAQPAQHFALSAVISGLAGLCEGKLLLRKTV
ncbi:MAG TPA: gamma-glutamylcyclotransferase family protein [Ktedonobacteraceae bacterium]|nr:gamma-glutamylcyclotransferase family protein [Ktedonobacteraceae bacterium]